MQMLSRKALLPLVVFLSVKAFPAKIVSEGCLLLSLPFFVNIGFDLMLGL